MIESLTSGDPQTMGPYRLLARLGSGSFGTVYAARHVDHPEQLAAVKVAHSNFSDIADFPAHFRREVDAIRPLASDFVPKFIDARAGVNVDRAWIATELIPGPALRTVVRRHGRLPEEAVWRLGAGIASALKAIHDRGLVHRDLRPKNVLLVPNGPWVIDFNLAHLVDMAHRDASVTPRADYGYMPPEEAYGGLRAAEEPADVFALGATLVFAATGHPPLEAATPAEAMNAIPNLDGLPDGLRGLVEGSLRPEPEDRLSLDGLLREFTSRTGGASRDGFAAALPPEVVARLQEYRDELADMIGARGPARLGWSVGIGQAAPEARPGGPEAARPVDLATAVPVLWTSQLGGWISGPVTAHAGKLVVALLDGAVAVLDAADGKPRGAAWRVDVGAALHAAPLVATGKDGLTRAYAGTADGRVHAIDLALGRDEVIAETAAAIEGTPVMVEAISVIEGTPVSVGERICVLSADGRVHSVDRRTGEQKELFQMDASATGALSAAFGTVFATDTDGWMHAIDADTGQPKWHVGTDGLVLCAPLPVAAWLYACGTDGVLREIAIVGGKQRAVADVRAPVHVAPVRDGNLLYVGSSDGVVHAYEIGRQGPGRLKEIWTYHLDDEIAGLAASGGRVYVAAGGRLVEISGSARPERELLSMDCLIGASPVISGQHCYVVGLGGTVSRLMLSNLRPISSVATEGTTGTSGNKLVGNNMDETPAWIAPGWSGGLILDVALAHIEYSWRP